MLLLARTSLFALTTGTRALRTSPVPRMAAQVPRPNLGSSSESEAAYTINGGSQSFNAVNELRRLARWMRMVCTTNQSSVPKAWQEFDDDGRMKPSSLRERVVDVMEEHMKMTRLVREHADYLVDRYSERVEVAAKGRLLTQEEKEREKVVQAARSA